MALRNRVVELRASNLPRCSWSDILKVGDGGSLDSGDVAALDEYFRHFLTPAASGCVGCGRALGGLLGSFAWGIQNGEGACSSCGYPARAIHRDVGPIQTMQVILQYHPDELRFDGEDAGLPQEDAEPVAAGGNLSRAQRDSLEGGE